MVRMRRTIANCDTLEDAQVALCRIDSQQHRRLFSEKLLTTQLGAPAMAAPGCAGHVVEFIDSSNKAIARQTHTSGRPCSYYLARTSLIQPENTMPNFSRQRRCRQQLRQEMELGVFAS